MRILKQYLLEQVAGHKLPLEQAKQMLAEIASTSDQTTVRQEEIAIIGMAGRFPRSADLAELWDNIIKGINCIGTPSQERRDEWENYLKSYFDIDALTDDMLAPGGYLDDINKFDAGFFGISLKEARYMDPWQRLMIETVYLALEDAGLGGKCAFGTNTGVFIGRDHACESSYAKMVGNVHPLVLTGSYASILASRISHTFNFQGPSIVIDTACSSALVAVHQACLSLRSGQCSMAVAGGINLRENFLHLGGQPMQSILTEEAEVRAFDKRSKGTLISEGVGAVLLKPLDKALEDGDRIYAVVKGSAVNNDGGTNRIATPSAKSQQRVIEESWKAADVHPETISYIEAHGTGTLLGDSIEVKALTNAFKNYTDRRQFCAMSTIKSNIGHTVAASGMASLMKAVLALKYQQIPFNIHFKEVNPYIDFTDSAVYVSDRLTDWQDVEHPRRCGVNSFGFSGTNCHVVLEEPPSRGSYCSMDTPAGHDSPHIFAMSARDDASLQELVLSYKLDLQKADLDALDLRDICYTSLCGRGHYGSRIMLLVKSAEELYFKISRLHEEQALNNIAEPNVMYGFHKLLKYDKDNKQPGEISNHELQRLNGQAALALEQCCSGHWEHLDELCHYYVKGAEINWQRLFRGERRRKVKLPLYPLQRSKVWFDVSEQGIKNAREKRRLQDTFRLAENSHQVEEGPAAHSQLITEEERLLTGIWQEVLAVEKVDVNGNFFGLGGDSIKMLQVLSKAKEQGLFFSLEAMFEHQTVQELAKVTHRKHPEENTKSLQDFALISKEDRALMPAGIMDAYPISSLQAGMLFHSQWSTSSEAFHNILSLHIRAKLNEPLFRQAAQLLANRHAILRTSFDFVNYSIPLQLIQHHVEVPVIVDSICMLTSEEQEEKLRQWRSVQRMTGFDWSQAPLFRFYIHYRSEDTFQLSLVFHHSILDGWSVSAMLTELFKLYTTLMQGDNQAIPSSASIEFRDYIAEENRVLQSQDTSNYWLNKLKGATASPILGRKISSDVREHKYLEEKRFIIDEQLYNRLAEVGREQGMPIKTIFLTAHIRVIKFISGQKDVLTGVVVNGRLETPGGDKTLGLFLNTLPFHFGGDGETWKELLSEVFRTEQDMMPHRRFPLSEIQKRLGQPLILSTIFNYNNFHVYNEMNEQGQLEVLSDEMFELTDVPLYVRFIQGRFNHEITLGLQYDPNVFTDQDIDRIGHYYLKALDDLSRHSSRSSCAGNLLSRDEQEQMEVWNHTSAPLDRRKRLSLQIAEHARAIPDSLALVCGDNKLTFADLEKQANTVAAGLTKAGISNDMLVGVFMKRSIQAVASLLGIWKVGAVYVPLDYEYPLHRIRYMIRDANLNLILTQDETDHLLMEDNTRIWNVDDPAGIPAHNGIAPASQNQSSDLEDFAYLIYTSGSTGQPKGVMGRHSGLLNRCNWMWSQYPFQEGEVCCFKTSMSFIDSLGEVLTPLAQGVPVVILSSEIVSDPALFIRAIREHRVSRLVVVPSYLRILLELYPDLSLRLPDLNMCVTSGEELTPKIARLWQKSMPDKVLLNLYGSSEVSADVLYYELSEELKEDGIVPLGRPIFNSCVYILNADLEQVPVGVEGNVYIGGDGVAIGYWGREDWTAERFIDSPFEHCQSKLYQTGDLGLFNSDGHVIFKGRKDHQVNVRGFRIELQEVELTLQRHAWVDEAVVTIAKDANDDESLIGYIASNGGVQPSPEELREFLKNYLPAYMVPGSYCFLNALPKLPNGKTDRGALPSASVDIQMADEAGVIPSPVTQTVCAIWSNTLGMSPRGVHDNFFAAGGNSLKAMRFIFMLQREFHIRLDMKQFYASPTLDAIVKFIKRSQREQSSVHLIPQHLQQQWPLASYASSGTLGPYPLTPSQQNIWIHQQFHPDSTAYHVTMSMDIWGTLDIEGFQWSFNSILKKHSALRTLIEFDGTAPYQLTTEYTPYSIEIYDARGLPEEERNELRQQRIHMGSERVSDVSEYPLFHMQGLWLDAQHYQFLLTIHHLIFDFWSIGVLMRELSLQYESWLLYKERSDANTSAPETEVSENKTSYFDYVRWEKSLMEADDVDRKLLYWKKVLGSTLPALRLPTDRPRGPETLKQGERGGMLLPEELVHKLTQFSQNRETTAFIVLLAAFYALLYRYTSAHDMIIGVPVSNRVADERFDALIGCCIDTIALRANFPADTCYEEILLQVREAFLNAYTDHRLPHGYIMEKVYPSDSKATSPFQYMFNYMSIQDWNVRLPGSLMVSTAMIPAPYPKYELSAEILETGEGLWLNIEYTVDLYDADTIESIMSDYCTLTLEMLMNPDMPVSHFSLAHQGEHHTHSLESEALFDF
ncbi:amino acid adenylation domain-containing protein [Paenibacillus oleatilyticus]|uniref:Amino acid adenylation domain-containing protein n=1 Tax=Paenibacillus oleatilyticus TaxID=2594886 RepID=A0ABV4VA73_9BACL